MRATTILTTKPPVSIIIVNYNGGEYLTNCLSSILRTKYPNFEVIVVDNASTDESLHVALAQFGSNPKIKFIPSSENLGFAGGNNLGAKHANGEYLVFLNFDTLVDPSWITEAITTMTKNPKAGVGQCKLLRMSQPEYLDNTGHFIDCAGIAYFIGEREKDGEKYSYPYKMFGAMGAAMIVRANVFRELEGFDPDYFILFEESDLCWRVWISGYEVIFIPKAKVYHKGAVSCKLRPSKQTAYFFVRNRLMSMLKNYQLKNLFKFVPLNFLLMLGLSLFKVKQRNLEEFKGIIEGLVWSIFHMRKVMLKRSVVQRKRRIPDSALIGSIIKRFEFSRGLRKAAQFGLVKHS